MCASYLGARFSCRPVFFACRLTSVRLNRSRLASPVSNVGACTIVLPLEEALGASATGCLFFCPERGIGRVGGLDCRQFDTAEIRDSVENADTHTKYRGI